MLKLYNPKDCVTTINDSIALTGYAETMISASKDNALVTIVEGAQGDAVGNVSNSKVGTMTITLLATSPSNAVMMNLAKNREIFSIWCNDKSLGEKAGGSEAVIETYPTVDKANVAGNRVYTVKVADFDVIMTNE
jgi:hypothetical protein